MGISPAQFATLQNRLQGRKPAATPVMDRQAAGSKLSSHQIVLGVDPSLRGTGYGVIALKAGTPTALAHGTISCPAGWERSRCLARIAVTLRDLIQQHHPTVCAIEGLFFAQNLQTALIMGEARGAALATLGEAGLEILEMAPRKVKQAIVGYGAAQKTAVAAMVQRMLRLAELPDPDAADALALALAYAHETRRFSLQPVRKI